MIERRELLATLMSIDDINELKLMRSAINDRIEEVGSRVKYQLSIGDSVIVTSKKGVKPGTINKVNRTQAVVDLEGTLYNVPFSMITKQ